MHPILLSEIWIYPIKSLRGISVPSARVLGKGLEYDRRMMLVDDNNVFLTQRVHHQMALFQVSIEGHELVVRLDHDAIRLNLKHQSENPDTTVTIWDDQVVAREYSQAVSKWFSEKMNFSCKLMCFPEGNERRVDPEFSINNEHVSLADAYPILVIGESSLNELNNRLERPVPMNRFRPNFVVRGSVPFEEDQWKHFTIGTNRFAGVKPCARCILTTVDQETGIRGTEPLATLATYRKKNNKIYFGQNVLALDHFQVSVGDQVLVH